MWWQWTNAPELTDATASVDWSVAVVFKPLAIKIRHEDELRRGVNSTLLNMTDFCRNNTKIKTKSDNVFNTSHFCDITSETEAGVPGLGVSRHLRGNPAQETRAKIHDFCNAQRESRIASFYGDSIWSWPINRHVIVLMRPVQCPVGIRRVLRFLSLIHSRF